MRDDAMKKLRKKPWMALSQKPPLKDWLQPKMDGLTQARLKALGNVVVPAMANFGANVISRSPIF